MCVGVGEGRGREEGGGGRMMWRRRGDGRGRMSRGGSCGEGVGVSGWGEGGEEGGEIVHHDKMLTARCINCLRFAHPPRLLEAGERLLVESWLFESLNG